MPRPKRTKIQPSGTVSRASRSTESQPAKATLTRPRQEFNDLYDVSSPPKPLEKTAQRVMKHNGKGQEVGRASEQSDDDHAWPYRDQPEDDIVNIGQAASVGAAEPGSSSPDIEVGRREQPTPAVGSSVLAIGNFRRRPRQPSILGRAAGRARSSSIESDLAHDSGLSDAIEDGPAALEAASVNRPGRAASISGIKKPFVVTGSVVLGTRTSLKVGSAVRIGHFKRRARESSILGGARLEQESHGAHDREDSNDGEEDDFDPDDESTRLNLRTTQHQNDWSGLSSSSSRKRKLSGAESRKLTSSPPPPVASQDGEDPIPATYPEEEPEEDAASISDDGQSIMSSTEVREVLSEPLSDTMAPPQSSSPLRRSPALAQQRQAPTRGRGRPRNKTPQPRYDEDSDIPSPPSLTHSPDRHVPATAGSYKTKPKPPPSTFSTRQLQNLLPRRRRRPARDVFDVGSSEDEVDASGLASDDDELTHINPRTRARRPTNVLARTPAPAVKKVTKLKATRKETASLRTYGSRRHATSDKENDDFDPNDSLAPLPDSEGNARSENSQEMEERLGKELKQAARKFAEVDKWDLEFEEVSHRASSPVGAR